MPESFVTSLYLSDKAAFERLRAVAAAQECYQTRGVGTGELGSVGALNQALADGQVVALRASALATVVTLLTDAYAALLPHEPGRAAIADALRLLGHDPDPELELAWPEGEAKEAQG